MKLRCEFNGITTLKRNGFGYDWLKRFHDKPFKSKIKDFVFSTHCLRALLLLSF